MLKFKRWLKHLLKILLLLVVLLFAILLFERWRGQIALEAVMHFWQRRT